MSSSISGLLRAAKSELAGSTTSGLDAEVLLQHCLGRDRAWLLSHPDRELKAADVDRFRELVRRRARGEPVAYLTGQREFWSLPLQVNTGVLVPRPETELLVERALSHVAQDAEVTLLDLGTGSGAIALAIAHERPYSRVTGTDCSQSALDVARDNAGKLAIDNVTFARGDWYAAVAGQRFDIIVSNPPYVEDNDPHLRESSLSHEPIHALRAGPDGMRDLAHIITQAEEHLNRHGWLLVEHGAQQANAVCVLMEQHGLRNIATHKDLASLPRVTEGQKADQLP